MAAGPAKRRDATLGRWAALAVTVLFVTASACGRTHPTCYDGEYLACSCDDGASGFRACGASGVGYGVCVCDGKVPGLDASIVETSAPDAGDAEASAPSKKKFLEPCEKDEQCESGICFTFNARGPLCTLRCKPGDPCPAPSPGCSNNGVCKSG